jgi:hypothetical protein
MFNMLAHPLNFETPAEASGIIADDENKMVNSYPEREESSRSLKTETAKNSRIHNADNFGK